MSAGFVQALPWISLAAGLLIMVGGVIAVLKIDERFFSRDNYCCRCREEWHGIEKLCRCGARGEKYRTPEPVTPTHDWQGYLDTNPIPIVRDDLFDPDRLAAVPITAREDMPDG